MTEVKSAMGLDANVAGPDEAAHAGDPPASSLNVPCEWNKSIPFRATSRPSSAVSWDNQNEPRSSNPLSTVRATTAFLLDNNGGTHHHRIHGTVVGARKQDQKAFHLSVL